MPIINYLEQPKGWKPGIYQLDSYEHYASIPALRSSQLKKLDKSPAHYKASILFKPPISAQLQKSFDKGKAFDTLVLHGAEAFEALIAVEPDLHRNSKKYKDWKARNFGRVILTDYEKADILEMYRRAMSKIQFASIFAGNGYPHRAIIWQDKGTGIWCKAEIDWICLDGTVVDLKSAADAGFWFFQRQARRLGYVNQGAFYLDGLNHLTGIEHTQFKLAVIETEQPFESHVFRVGMQQLYDAQKENEERMSILKGCLERDEWPGYPDRILDLESGHYEYDEDLDNLMEVNTYGF